MFSMFSRRRAGFALAVASVVIGIACGGGDDDGSIIVGFPRQRRRPLGRGRGRRSSTVGPIAEAAAEEFGKVSNVNVVVGFRAQAVASRSSAGARRTFRTHRGPIRREELQLCTDGGVEMTELSIGYDGLTVAVNTANAWATCLTFTQLRSIFDVSATATSWDQVDPSFPAEPLTIYSPGADSGTLDFFTEEVNGVVDQSRSENVTFSEDDNVLVQGIETTDGAIGYFGYAYYLANQDKLKALELNRDITRDGLPVPADQQRGCSGPMKRR